MSSFGRCCSLTYPLVTVFVFIPPEKECDPDKHCGVLDPARKTLCTRQLMCNVIPLICSTVNDFNVVL